MPESGTWAPGVCCFFPAAWLPPLPRLSLPKNTAVPIPGSSLTFLPTTGRARDFQDIFHEIRIHR